MGACCLHGSLYLCLLQGKPSLPKQISLGQWLSCCSVHRDHLECSVRTESWAHHQSFRLSGCGVSPHDLHFCAVLGFAAAGPGTTL